MLCDSVAQVNDICNMNEVTVNMVVLKSFEQKNLASVQNFNFYSHYLHVYRQ